MTILKIAGDLERIIDLGNNVARCGLAADGQTPLVSRLLSMTELVQSRLALALKALTERDVEMPFFYGNETKILMQSTIRYFASSSRI